MTATSSARRTTPVEPRQQPLTVAAATCDGDAARSAAERLSGPTPPSTLVLIDDATSGAGWSHELERAARDRGVPQLVASVRRPIRALTGFAAVVTDTDAASRLTGLLLATPNDAARCGRELRGRLAARCVALRLVGGRTLLIRPGGETTESIDLGDPATPFDPAALTAAAPLLVTPDWPRPPMFETGRAGSLAAPSGVSQSGIVPRPHRT